jgi:hypothetical protein
VIELLSRQLSRLKAGPVELEWARAVVEVQGEVPPAREMRAITPPPANLSDLVDLAERSPARVILEGYRRVEQTLAGLVDGAGLGVDQPVDARQLARLAARADLISSETVRSVDGVAVLRNLAAHRPDDVTTAKALEYLALVEAVLYSLGGVARRRQTSGSPS